ncbi:TetR/AcrR family transcriptional regulator [Streptomyces sp. BE147]|uniref:TetR/AcrR family transcriptional regulator n=1 Tax=Streptomyces sp. BE147 TaxID=3002524 RepID=UPI002E75AECC|nr:TetR/AcrR family transcriptional regulator [Streptomyces sp. BE147]MEE1737047.1 TetR/AcrR family transcriptional regulator [Streptomyces sp. BE147]
MSGPQQDRSRTTRERLVYGAALVFADMGYAASINDITEASSVKKGAIYHHFKSKGEIAEAVMDEGAVRDEPMPESAPAPPAQELTMVQMVVDQSIRLAVLTPEVPAVRAAHRLATEPGTPFFGRIWRHYQPVVVQVLQQAHDEGELLPWIDPEGLAKTWIAAYTGYDLIRRSDPEHLPQDVYELNRSMVVQGVRPEIQRELDLTIERGRRLASSHPLYTKAKALAEIYS